MKLTLMNASNKTFPALEEERALMELVPIPAGASLVLQEQDAITRLT